jgi:hypothetical protein
MTVANEVGYLWDEAIPDIFEDVLPELPKLLAGLSSEQWSEISDALNEHVSNARDFMAPTPSAADLREMNDRPIITALRADVARLEAERGVIDADILRVKGGKYIEVDMLSKRVVIHDDRW